VTCHVADVDYETEIDTSAPLPHVAIQCLPGMLALRWLHDAHGTTRLTLIVRGNRAPTGERPRQIPTEARDIVGCIAFAVAAAGIARADAAALKEQPRVVRISYGVPVSLFVALEVCWTRESSYSIVVAEPSFRSPAETMATLDALITSVAGRQRIHPPLPLVSPDVEATLVDASPEISSAFASIQRQSPAIIRGVLPREYRLALANAVAAAGGPGEKPSAAGL
jgi:hypothetical protein